MTTFILDGVAPDPVVALDDRELRRSSQMLGTMLDMYTPNVFAQRYTQGMYGNMVADAAPATGGAFLQGELELPDFNLNEPLTSVTWMRDIPYKTGGGFVANTSNFFVDYATAGANEYGLMGVDTNNLPTIQGNVTKDVYPVNRFGYIIKVPLIGQARMQMVGRSLEGILQDGLRLNYDKMLDRNAYLGLPNIDQKGLLNQPESLNAFAQNKVYQMHSPANGSGNSRKWADKTADQILADFNSALVQAWENAEYDDDGMPNHVGLPPAVFANLVSRKVSDAGNVSILTYLLENNIAKQRGINLQIVPMRQCNEAGTIFDTPTASGRMVAYRNDKKRLHFDETVPLTRLLTRPSVNDMAYLSGYVASVGVLKILYFQTIIYMDGIS